jgi:hypothetical protein
MNKSILKIIVFIVVFLYGVTSAQTELKVVSLKGNIQIKKSQSTQWEILSASVNLAKEDQLRTTGNSEIEITWAQNASLKLFENSMCTVQKIETAELDVMVDIGKVSVDYNGVKGTIININTPSAQTWAKQKSQFEITVQENFTTEMQVNTGMVIAKAQDVVTQTLVREQYTIKMQKGFLGAPQPLKGKVVKEKGQAPEEKKEEFAILGLEVPLENEIFSVPAIEVTGQYKQQGTVTVNSQGVTLDKNGAFSTMLEFPEGKNEIQVTATNPSGEKVELKRVVFINTILPEIQFFVPNNGPYTNQIRYNLRGVTHDDTPFDKVRVLINGKEIPLNAGGFSEYINLREGKNPISIEAHDLAENVSILDTNMFLDTQTPQVVVYSPRGVRADLFDPPLPPYRAVNQEEKRQHFTVEGRVMDPEPSSGIAKLTINGIDMPIEEDGSFSGDVILQLGANRLTIVCRDLAGNEFRDDTRIIDFK